MKPSERKTVNIKLNVDGKTLKFVVDLDDEVAYREAAKSINDDVVALRGRFASTVKDWDDEMAIRYATVMHRVQSIIASREAEDANNRLRTLAKEIDDVIIEG